LYTRALLEELPAAALADPRGPMPSPPSYALVVLGRLAACPVDVQDLVVAAAVLGTPCPLELAGRLADLKRPLDVLDRAVAARLLEARGGAGEVLVEFPHPLLRSAVYHDLGPARRAQLHTDAAALSLDPDTALRHQVAAASGPDPELVDALVQSARAQAAQGAWAAAAHTLRSAAHLTRGMEKEDLLLDAADALLVGGYVGEATTLLEEEALTPTRSPRRLYVQARLASTNGHQAEAAALLLDAWERTAPSGDHNLRAQVAGLLANVRAIDLYWAEGLTWAQRALEEAQDGGVFAYAMPPLILGIGLSGRMDEALAMMNFIPDPPPADLGPDAVSALTGRGTLRLWTDDYEGALRDSLPVTEASWNLPMQHRLFSLVIVVESEYRLGLWDDAVFHGELATSTGRDTDQIWVLPLLHAVAVLPLAGRGQWEAAEAHARAAAAAAAVLGNELGRYSAGWALGTVAAAREDFEAVAVATRPLRALRRLDSLGDPGIVPWRELLAEALVALGHLEEAEEVLAPYEAAMQRWDRSSRVADAARVRGRLEAARSRRDDAEKAFLSGLAMVDPARLPFEAARIEMD
ncbi:MAG: LuxR family transcriptional regulator, partial [Acidimicrobiia bacterium]